MTLAIADSADVEVRDHLIDYLTGVVTLREFSTWFAPVAWEHIESSEVIARIELALAEYTAGHATEAEVRAELEPFASQYAIVAGDVEAMTITTVGVSQSSVTRQVWADTPLSAGFSLTALHLS